MSDCGRPECIGWGCPVCDARDADDQPVQRHGPACRSCGVRHHADCQREARLESALQAIMELPTYDMFSGWGGGSMDRVDNGDWIDSDAQEIARVALEGEKS